MQSGEGVLGGRRRVLGLALAHLGAGRIPHAEVIVIGAKALVQAVTPRQHHR